MVVVAENSIYLLNTNCTPRPPDIIYEVKSVNLMFRITPILIELDGPAHYTGLTLASVLSIIL